jgi:phage terminase large subunit-like protein
MAGRGWGKNRVGAEHLRELVEQMPGSHGALVSRTAADTRDTMILNPLSGIMDVFPPRHRPLWEPSKRRITFHTGAWATTYSGDKPDQLRGPQHHWAWAEEVSTWRYPEALDMLRFGLRIGEHPQLIVTMTPRPTKHVRELLALPGAVVTRGRTLDNEANLAPAIVEELYAKYGGTRLGRQELDGELLEDVEGALWQRHWIDSMRATSAEVCTGDHSDDVERAECQARVHIEHSVVAVDPGGSGESNDPTAIGVAGRGDDGMFYVLDSYQMRKSPQTWAKAALRSLDIHRAGYILGETNHGGEMVKSTLQNERDVAPVRTIHAKRGKVLRADPVSLLYEGRKVRHLGQFPELEDQMCAFDGLSERSPDGEHWDLLDAAVYALLEVSKRSAGGLEVI